MFFSDSVVRCSGSVAEWEDCCGPAGAEEDVEEGAILRTHRRRVLGKNDAPVGGRLQGHVLL